MSEIIFAKSKTEFTEWDNFVTNSPKGNHLVLSDWLNSFKSYGFENEIIFIKENNEIVAGLGAVIAKFSFFKFYIIPYGPIFNISFESKILGLLETAIKSSKEKSCCYFEITTPTTDSEKLAPYSYPSNLSLGKDFKSGKLFKYVYAASGINLLDLTNYNSDSAEDLLMSFSVRTRRDIRIGIKNIDRIDTANSIEQIKAAYDLCILNAKQANYSIRDWESIRRTLSDMIVSKQGFFLMAYSGDTLVGSIFLIKAGKHLTYIFGGTKKEFGNIYPGYALQWEAIKLSLELRYDWYNISLGGSAGVKKFKGKFNTEELLYNNPHHHLILSPLRFRLFLIFEKQLKPYKAKIAKWLSSIK